MNDTCEPAVREQDSLRTMAIVAFILLLLGIVTAHLAAIGGVIIAYIQRDEARCTVWRSHYDAIIETFWIALVGWVVGAILLIVGVGVLIWAVLAVWYLYRTIRGLVHAIDAKPY